MFMDLIVMRRVIEFKEWIFVAKSKGHKQKASQIDDMEIRYNCAKRYHVLYVNCAKGIIFGLVSVLNVIKFLLTIKTMSINLGGT